jgi:hemoglobin
MPAAAPITQASPDVLHSSDATRISHYSDSLLCRLGGQENLEIAVVDFYKRSNADPKLRPFFKNVSMTLLRAHQTQFMTMAFTEIPEGFDATAFIIERHYRLFEIGLNETHFDLVAGHLVAAFQQMSVEPDLIDEVVQVLVPFRNVFTRVGREEKIMDYMRNVMKKKQEIAGREARHKMQRQREREQGSHKEVPSPKKGAVMKDQDKRHHHSFLGSNFLGVIRRGCSLGKAQRKSGMET